MKIHLVAGALVAAAIFYIFFFPFIHLVAFVLSGISVIYFFTLLVLDGDLTLILYETFGNKGGK